MHKLTLVSLIVLLALPLSGSAQESYPYPDVWWSAGTQPRTPDKVQALIGLLGPGSDHRHGGCIPSPEWGKGMPADKAAAELVQVGMPAINALLPLLQDKEPKRRRLVVEILGRIGDRTVTPALLPLLQSEKDENVRESVVESLAMLRDLRTEEALIQALHDRNGFVQKDAAIGLAWLKSTRGIAPLAQLLRAQTHWEEGGEFGRTPQLGLMTSIALGWIGAPALPALRDLLSDPTTPVFALNFAIQAIVRIEEKRAIPDLKRMLEHSDDAVRITALNLLMQWPDALPVPLLAHLMQGPKGQTSSAAGCVLASRGDQASREALVQALFSPHESERLTASGALDYLKSPDATPTLLRVLQMDDKVAQTHAARALGALQDKRSLPVLIQALDNPNEELRRVAAIGLGDIDDPRAIEPLLHALKDPAASVRMQGIYSLQAKNDPRIVPALQPLVMDQDYAVRGNATYTIGFQTQRQWAQK